MVTHPLANEASRPGVITKKLTLHTNSPIMEFVHLVKLMKFSVAVKTLQHVKKRLS